MPYGAKYCACCGSTEGVEAHHLYSRSGAAGQSRDHGGRCNASGPRARALTHGRIERVRWGRATAGFRRRAPTAPVGRRRLAIFIRISSS
jgi:hypothetical protein